jgi:hypothetical protein
MEIKMDITQVALYNPTITPIAVATIGSLAILGTIFWQRAAIINAFNTIRPKVFTRSGFFWGSILVFMAASVVQAGAFFSINGDAIGFGIAFFLDLVTVVLMHAQLESRYRGEHGRANLFIFFIILTCGMSSYANLAISQNNFDAAKMLPHASDWVQRAAPYALASFPLFVIMMSIAAEKIVNVRPLDKLEESEFEADEQKRVRILQIRNQYALQQAQLSVNRKIERQRIKADQEERQQQIKAQRLAQRMAYKAGKQGRTFFLVSWLFPKDPVNIQQVTAGVTAQLQAIYEPQIEELKRNFEAQRTANTTEVSNGQVTPDDQQDRTDAKTSDKNTLADIPTNSTQSSSSLALEDLPNDVQVVVSHYPNVYNEWLAQNIKSVTIPQIVEVTRHRRQRVSAQVGKALKRTPANENKYTVTSVIDWLKIAPLPANKEQNTDAIPVGQERIDDLITGASTPQYWSKDENTEVTPATNGHTDHPEEQVKISDYPVTEPMEKLSEETSTSGMVPQDNGQSSIIRVKTSDRLSIALAAMRINPALTDIELATMLSMERPANARLWRLKAQEILDQEKQNGHALPKDTVKLDEYPAILV